jgi:signal transduction histidine kinase
LPNPRTSSDTADRHQYQRYLLERSISSRDQIKHIRRIEEQVASITHLVDDLTTMSRLDGGPQLSLATVDLNTILRTVHQTMGFVSTPKNLVVTLELSEQPLFMVGDAARLGEAIERLWHNAICYTPDGGSIIVRSGSDGDQVMVEIADTGVGIREEDLDRIFERFYRADEAGTTRGFGLGLPIARAIIELHQGSIEVESKIGQGSVFRVRLPVNRPVT